LRYTASTLGKKVTHLLGRDLCALEERSFEDGEHKIRPVDTVAGSDVTTCMVDQRRVQTTSCAVSSPT